MTTVLLPPKLTATEVQHRQAEIIVETYETLPDPKTLRHEKTKPGDPAVYRGFPILVEGGLPGTITSSHDMNLCLHCGRPDHGRPETRCRCHPLRVLRPAC